MKRTRRGLLTLLLAGTSLAQISGTAMASGFALRENSAATLGTAFAGAGSAAEDLSTIFWNPAGMTRFSGHQTQLTGTLIVPSIQFDGNGTSLGGLAPTGGGDGGDGGVAAVAPAFYGLIDFSPDLKAGLAVTMPFGLMTKYDSDWVGRYHGIKSDIKSTDINPNIAYRVSNWLSVGGGVSAQYFSTEFTNAINSTAIAGSALPDGSARFEGDDWGWGFNLGILLEPVMGTRVGVTYRSSVEHEAEGDAKFAVPAALAGVPNFQNSKATSDATLPETVAVSLTQVLTPRLTLVSDIQWTRWSRIEDLTIRRSDGSDIDSTPMNFDDTFFFSVGGIYRATENWTFRAGFAYDQTPVTDEYRTVRLPDEDRYLLALGATFKVSEAFQIDAGYLHYFMPDATMNKSENRDTVTGDVLSGDFSMHSDIVSLSGRLRF